MFDEVGIVDGIDVGNSSRIDDVGKERVCQVEGCAGVDVDSSGGAAPWLRKVHLCGLRTVLCCVL